MIYLKTYCYAPHEIDFVIANLKECYDHIDKMIVCEFDIHHTGVKREFEYRDLKERVPEELRDKLDYHACEVFDITARAYEDESTQSMSLLCVAILQNSMTSKSLTL